jgi:NAD(P)-dependent dehydrogenase (short-subunit alcohol dehydrogenase family)
VAPGPVETPMHKDDPPEAYTDKQALKTVTQVSDIVDAVLYLARANQVTGEILYVDGGSHAGR